MLISMDSVVLQKRFAYIVMAILVSSTLAIAPSAQSDATIDLKLIHIKLNEEEGHNPPPKVDEDRQYWLRYKINSGEPGSFQIAIETCSAQCNEAANWNEATRDLDGDGIDDNHDSDNSDFTNVYFTMALSGEGPISVRAFLDPDNAVEEVRENNNNHLSSSFSVEPADGDSDLYVHGMSTSVLNDSNGEYDSSSKIEAGDTLRLDIEYGNKGDASSASSYTNPMKVSLFFHDDDTAPEEGDQLNESNFDGDISPEFPSSSVDRDGVAYYYIAPTDSDKPALTQVTWSVPMSGMDDGFYTFTFLLDANDDVSESDETNNEHSVEICLYNRNSNFCELSDLTGPIHSNPKPFTAATGPEGDNGNAYPGDMECGPSGNPCISGTTTYILFKIRNDGSYTTHNLEDASVQLSTRFCGEVSEDDPTEENCNEWGVEGEFQPFTGELEVAGPQRDQPVDDYFVIAWDAPNTPGYWDLQLILDSSDILDEEDESNNEFSFMKTNEHFVELVERKADLQISSFDISTEVVVQNYTTNLEVWVDQTDLGTLDAENVCVTLDIEGPTDATSGHIVIPGPGGGPLLKNIGIDDAPLLFGYEWTPTVEGVYNITATVNPPTNDTYTHVVEWDDEDEPPNENNQLVYQWIEVMPIIPDLVIYPEISNFIPVMDVSPTTSNGFAMVGVDSIINFTIKNEGYRDLFANESFVLKIQDKYQAEIDEISLSGPIAMGDSITVQFPYVFEDEKRYEFHVSVDADNEITEIFEGICNWQTQGQEDNCQRFEVYAVTVIDTWISNLSIAEEEALLGNDHHLNFRVGMDFLAEGAQHNVYFGAYANSALTGYKLIVDGGNYQTTLLCDCTTGVDSTGIPYVSLTGDGNESVSVDITILWEPVGISAGEYDIYIELDTSWLSGLNSNLSNDIVCFANNPTLYRDDGGDCAGGSIFVNTFTTDLRIVDVYAEPGEVGINIVYVEIDYPAGELSNLDNVFVNVSIYVSDFALGAMSEEETFVEHLGLVMVIGGMNVGESKILEFEWTAPSGSYVIVADVDPTDLINEYNEYNNRLVSGLVKTSTTTSDGSEEAGGLIPSPPLISVVLLLLLVSLVRRRD